MNVGLCRTAHYRSMQHKFATLPKPPHLTPDAKPPRFSDTLCSEKFRSTGHVQNGCWQLAVAHTAHVRRSAGSSEACRALPLPAIKPWTMLPVVSITYRWVLHSISKALQSFIAFGKQLYTRSGYNSTGISDLAVTFISCNKGLGSSKNKLLGPHATRQY